MEPATAMLLGTGASALGSFYQNQQNKEQSEAQMRFQERMSSTAHQREVKDLQAAGLNPILSANSGASTPSGAQAMIQNPLQDAGNNVAKAMDLKIANQNLANQTAKTASEIQTNATQQAALAAQATASISNAKQTELNTEILRKTSPYQIEKSELDRQMLIPDAILNRVGTAVGIGRNAKDAIFGGIGRGPTMPSDLGRSGGQTYDKKTGLIYPPGTTPKDFSPSKRIYPTKKMPK